MTPFVAVAAGHVVTTKRTKVLPHLGQAIVRLHPIAPGRAANAVNGDGGLCNVGGHHHLPRYKVHKEQLKHPSAHGKQGQCLFGCGTLEARNLSCHWACHLQRGGAEVDTLSQKVGSGLNISGEVCLWRGGAAFLSGQRSLRKRVVAIRGTRSTSL